MAPIGRDKIPSATQNKILYDSAYACVICQKGDIHLHHIDQNNANNVADNLIVLCMHHHGEAHTQRQLSTNLNPARLKRAKRDWETQVSKRRLAVATNGAQRRAAGEFLGIGVTWGYINHRRVADLLTEKIFADVNKVNIKICKTRGLIDQNGILIPTKSISADANYIQASIYDRFEFGDDHRIHNLYSNYVDCISRAARPIHITAESWKKTWFRQFVSPGDFLFVNKAHYFKTVQEMPQNKISLAYTFKRKIRIEFLIETKNMFGTSSMTVSFSGHKNCAALVLVKSLEKRGTDLVIHCTPIALGVGYWPLQVLSDFNEHVDHRR